MIGLHLWHDARQGFQLVWEEDGQLWREPEHAAERGFYVDADEADTVIQLLQEAMKKRREIAQRPYEE